MGIVHLSPKRIVREIYQSKIYTVPNQCWLHKTAMWIVNVAVVICHDVCVTMERHIHLSELKGKLK